MGTVKNVADAVDPEVPSALVAARRDREVPEADARGEIAEAAVVVDRIEESGPEPFEVDGVVGRPLVLLVLGGRRRGRGFLLQVKRLANRVACVFDSHTLKYSDLWIGDTGVMNVIQIPGRNRLLAITKFYPIFQSKDAAICLLEPTEKGSMSPWKIVEVLKLPFCHRIGIIENENGLFVMGCQLCEDKDFQDDWTKPGSIWMAPIPETAEGKWKLTKVFARLTKNHGLLIENENQVYICAENGVLCFDMAHYKAGESMQPRLVTTTPTSDIWINKVVDGRIAGTIEPFHGNTAMIYSAAVGPIRKGRASKLILGMFVGRAESLARMR